MVIAFAILLICVLLAIGVSVPLASFILKCFLKTSIGCPKEFILKFLLLF